MMTTNGNTRMGERLTRALRGLLIAAMCFAPTVALAQPKISGSLETVKGVRVLRVWGSPRDQGFANGYLMGKEIVRFVEHGLLSPSFLPDPSVYETKVRKEFLPRFRFDESRQREFEGMLAGIKAGLPPDQLRIERLQRDIDLDDLKAMNTMADWYRLGCSSVSVWGEATTDGGMITARNLDFDRLPGLDRYHVVVVNLEPGEGRTKWVAVGWPGLVGALTAMNDEGVTASMHDAPGLPITQSGPFVPRSVAIREIVETARGPFAVQDAKGILERSPAICGNNFHVSGPFKGQATPAAIFEYDGNAAKDGGVTLRTSSGNSDTSIATSVYCTNHYRTRAAPTSCNRYEAIESGLAALKRDGRKADPESMAGVIRSAAVHDTLHTALFLPNRRELWVAFGTPARGAGEGEFTALTLDELFKR